MSVGSYVIWNDLCQSVDSGEEDTGWPSYDAALSACSEGSDMPAYHGARGMVFGRSACERAVVSEDRAEREQTEYAARRAAVLASFDVPVVAPVTPVTPSADERRAKMLASNRAAHAAEMAKGRKADKAELARFASNIERLTALEVA